MRYWSASVGRFASWRGLKVLLVLGVASVGVGCKTTARLYPGPARSPHQIARISLVQAENPMYSWKISRVDGTEVTASEVEVLPGEHRLTIGFGSVSSLRDAAGTTFIILRFTADPGRIYEVSYEAGPRGVLSGLPMLERDFHVRDVTDGTPRRVPSRIAEFH